MRSIESMKKRKWQPDRELPMLDAILSGEKFWHVWAPAPLQIKKMAEVLVMMKAEHEYMCEHEPKDEFHACVLLGAINTIEGLLDKEKSVYDPSE